MATSKLKVVTPNGIAIEKGIPVPDGPRKLTYYPWQQMEVGDSFMFPAGKSQDTAYATSRAQSRNGKQFVIRKDGDGYRCWRVA